jgi:hypothetical protein
MSKFFDESIEANDNYNSLVSSLFGVDGSNNIDFHTLLNSNVSKYSIDSPLTLLNSVTVGSETFSIQWWCSRPDLVLVDTNNSSVWGNLVSSNIGEVTKITLYAKIIYNDASIIIAEYPFDGVLLND